MSFTFNTNNNYKFKNLATSTIKNDVKNNKMSFNPKINSQFDLENAVANSANNDMTLNSSEVNDGPNPDRPSVIWRTIIDFFGITIPKTIDHAVFSNYDGYDVSKLGYYSLNVEADCGSLIWNGRSVRALNFTDGKQIWFDEETKKPVLILDTRNPEIETRVYFDYDISQEERAEIEKLYISEAKLGDAPIDFIATANIRGHKIKFVSINADAEKAAMIANMYSRLFAALYSDEQLAMLEESFYGVLISPWENSSSPNSTASNGSHAAAYKWGTKDSKYYVYVPTDVDFGYSYYDSFYGLDIPIHEMGHAFESVFNDRDMINKEYWNSLFDKYKKTLPHLSGGSGYSAPMYTETPNEMEFFAESTLIYYTDPEQLKRYMPEVYNFLNDLYKKYE